MEGSNRRFSPRVLMALAMAMTAAQSPVPMSDDRRRRRHDPPQVTRGGMPRPSNSKYSCHQGKKECKRRLRQDFRRANPHTPYPAELAW